MNKNIFCNAPWFELHIFWDGSYGNCCQASPHKLFPEEQSNHYNVANMSIQEWHHSQVMNQLRTDILSDKPLFVCHRCYIEEDHSVTSRRHKCNQKSVIFTKAAFQDSLEQSPHYADFKYSQDHAGATSRMPVDLHVDLGNYCNLACKMCDARASSRIAVQDVKWGITESERYLRHDWTRDPVVWQRFLDDVVAMPVKNIHFMGGETILTRRFHDFVDYMIANDRLDLNFSFVTNGMPLDLELIEKLKKFGRVGIEVSIETLTAHNAYQRQGTDTEQVLDNMDQYLEHCNNSNITLTVRPAVSALTLGTFHTLLRYCLEKQILMKSLIVVEPEWIRSNNLPLAIRQEYLPAYNRLASDYGLDSLDLSQDFNESDPNQFKKIIRIYLDQARSLCQEPDNVKSDEHLQTLINHCARWDPIYGYNARDLYPEFAEIFDRYGYVV